MENNPYAPLELWSTGADMGRPRVWLAWRSALDEVDRPTLARWCAAGHRFVIAYEPWEVRAGEIRRIVSGYRLRMSGLIVRHQRDMENYHPGMAILAMPGESINLHQHWLNDEEGRRPALAECSWLLLMGQTGPQSRHGTIQPAPCNPRWLTSLALQARIAGVPCLGLRSAGEWSFTWSTVKTSTDPAMVGMDVEVASPDGWQSVPAVDLPQEWPKGWEVTRDA